MLETVERAVLRVQTWLPEEATGEVLAAAMQRGWPTRVGGVATGEARKLSVGPADWLVVGTMMDAASLLQAVASDLPQNGSVVVNLTDALAVIQLRSQNARSMLSSGCGLDLDPSRFGSGQCARTRLASVPVVIDCRVAHEFDLYVARSHGSYLRMWLADAAENY